MEPDDKQASQTRKAILMMNFSLSYLNLSLYNCSGGRRGNMITAEGIISTNEPKLDLSFSSVSVYNFNLQQRIQPAAIKMTSIYRNTAAMARENGGEVRHVCSLVLNNNLLLTIMISGQDLQSWSPTEEGHRNHPRQHYDRTTWGNSATEEGSRCL